MKKIVSVAFVLAAVCGCESIGLGPSKLRDDVKITFDPGLFGQTKGQDKVLKVIVKDADGVSQQDARVIVDLGGGGQIPKMTDASGEAVFSEIELKKVNSITVQKTEKTRKAGS